MKKLLLCMGVLFCMTSLHAEIRGISVSELEHLKHLGVKIIDIRKQNQIDKTGIIPTSYKLNFYQKDGSINRVIWLKRFVNLVNGRHLKFVLISKDGEQAKLGAKILQDEKGYTHPYYLKGGIKAWLDANKKMYKKH